MYEANYPLHAIWDLDVSDCLCSALLANPRLQDLSQLGPAMPYVKAHMHVWHLVNDGVHKASHVHPTWPQALPVLGRASLTLSAQRQDPGNRSLSAALIWIVPAAVVKRLSQLTKWNTKPVRRRWWGIPSRRVIGRKEWIESPSAFNRGFD